MLSDPSERPETQESQDALGEGASLRPGVLGLRLPAVALLLLAMSALFAATLIEFRLSELARRTFVFYDIDSGDVVVEERMLRRASPGGSPAVERDIAMYVEEALLGPISANAALLFPRGTELRTLLYRDGVVYADMCAAAVAYTGDEGLLRSFGALHAGIKRNFPGVGEVRFFVDGRAAFAGEFRR